MADCGECGGRDLGSRQGVNHAAGCATAIGMAKCPTCRGAGHVDRAAFGNPCPHGFYHANLEDDCLVTVCATCFRGERAAEHVDRQVFGSAAITHQLLYGCHIEIGRDDDGVFLRCARGESCPSHRFPVATT